MVSSTRLLIALPVALMGCGMGQMWLQWVQGTPTNRWNERLCQAGKPQRRSRREKGPAEGSPAFPRSLLQRLAGQKKCDIKSVTEKIMKAWCRLESSDVVRLRARS